MFNTKKWKFDKYCKMYAEFFNDQIPSYTNVNNEALQKLIISKYKNMQEEEKLLRENVIKDNISEYKNTKADLNPFITFAFVFVGYFIVEVIKKYFSSGLFEDYKLVVLYSFIGVAFFIFLIFNSAISSMRKTVNLGFWELCMNLLEMHNRGRFYSIDVKSKEIEDISKNIK